MVPMPRSSSTFSRSGLPSLSPYDACGGCHGVAAKPALARLMLDQLPCRGSLLQYEAEALANELLRSADMLYKCLRGQDSSYCFDIPDEVLMDVVGNCRVRRRRDYNNPTPDHDDPVALRMHRAGTTNKARIGHRISVDKES